MAGYTLRYNELLTDRADLKGKVTSALQAVDTAVTATAGATSPPDAVAVAGAESVQPTFMGAFHRVAGAVVEGDAGCRPVYRNKHGLHLYFWPTYHDWLIGPDYATKRAGVRSKSKDDAACPTAATSWKVAVDGTWSSQHAITVTPRGPRAPAPSTACPKQLCAVGAVARAQIVWDASPEVAALTLKAGWGGCFGGAQTGEGLLRLSSAVVPPFTSGAGGPLPSLVRGVAGLFAGDLKRARLFPCAAFKVPRGNGQPSANLLFAGRKVGHASVDFFDAAVATSFTEKASALVAPVLGQFRAYSAFPTQLGVSDFARSDRRGVVADATSGSPWCLVLIPTPAARSASPVTDVAANPNPKPDAFLAQLLGVPPGTVLYDVWAATSPAAVDPKVAALGGLLRVGRLETTSRFLRSTAELRFWHQRKEEDHEAHADWERELVEHGGAKKCGAEHFARMIKAGHCRV